MICQLSPSIKIVGEAPILFFTSQNRYLKEVAHFSKLCHSTKFQITRSTVPVLLPPQKFA